MVLEFAPLKVLDERPKNNKYKEGLKKGRKKNSNDEYEKDEKEDILCELSNLRSGMKNYQSIIDSYLEEGERKEKNQNYFRNNNPDYGWNGEWMSNTKRKGGNEKEEIDTYNLGFSEMDRKNMDNKGPISAILDDEGFVNNLYNYEDLQQNNNSSLFANEKPIDFNNQRMFLNYDDYDRYKYQNMSGSDMSSHKQKILHGDGKSFFLEDETDMQEGEDEVEDENVMQEDDALSDIINSSENNVFDEENSVIDDEDQSLVEEEIEKNDTQTSKNNSIKEIIIFVFAGIIIIFILEQIFKLGTLYAK